MPANLATIPGIVSERAASIGNNEADTGTFATVVVLVLLLLFLLFMLGGLFRAVGQGLGSILDSLFPSGTLFEPRTKVPTVTKSVESEDFFCVLPEKGHIEVVRDDGDDHFVLLPVDDVPRLHAPICFACGEPLDKGDHSLH